MALAWDRSGSPCGADGTALGVLGDLGFCGFKRLFCAPSLDRLGHANVFSFYFILYIYIFYINRYFTIYLAESLLRSNDGIS